MSVAEVTEIMYFVYGEEGAGWNLLALQRLSAEPGPLDMGQAWHIEVALILLGHIASVYLAHLIATKDKLPQTRERRRAEPADAIAAYAAATAEPTAPSGQTLVRSL